MLWTVWEIIQIKEKKSHVDGKTEREFERMFNLYSLWKESSSGFRVEYTDKMWAFKTALSILGYEFLFDKVEEQDGVKYLSYKLEEKRYVN